MNPILLNIPGMIVTNRLTIRHCFPGDGKVLNAAVIQSFESLKKWMPWAQKQPSLEESEEHVRRSVARWILREEMQMLVFERSSGVLVGSSGLHRINWDVPSFEIGYWVRTDHEGNGYITESTAAITLFAFKNLGAKRVEIRCSSENVRSSKVPERLNFMLDGTLRSDSRECTGNRPLRDTLVYSRTSPMGLPDVGATWIGGD